MPSLELRKRLDEMALFQRILWLAMTLAIVVYGLVLYAIVGMRAAAANAADERPVLVVLAVASAAASTLYRRRALSDRVLFEVAAGPVDLEAIARNPQTRQVDEGELALLRRLPLAEQRLLAVARAQFTPMMLGLALNASVALFGLVLGFLESSGVAYLPFGIAAVALNLAHFPRSMPFSAETERRVWLLRAP